MLLFVLTLRMNQIGKGIKMNVMDRWMKAVNFKITEGSDFGWDCFGPNAHCLSSWNGDQDGYSMCITFDTETQETYVVEACDYKRNRAYRFTNPDYVDAYKKEVAVRGEDSYVDYAWDGVKWMDLDVLDDYFNKVDGIISGADYDTRVQVPIDLDDTELFQLMMLAHEADLTLNQFVERLLQETIDRHVREGV